MGEALHALLHATQLATATEDFPPPAAPLEGALPSRPVPLLLAPASAVDLSAGAGWAGGRPPILWNLGHMQPPYLLAAPVQIPPLLQLPALPALPAPQLPLPQAPAPAAAGHSMKTKKRAGAFPCHICDRIFSFKSNLRRHEMTHTGARPYICVFCGAAENVLSSQL